MKLTIERAPMLAALSSIHGVVARKSTIPIITNFLLNADDGLSITATDLDMQATARVPARVEDAGTATISADKLYDIVRSLPEGAELAIDLPAGETRATIRAGRSRWTVAVLPAVDFPAMALDEPREGYDLPAPGLSRILTLGSYCMDAGGGRQYFDCAYLHAIDGAARVISTDGKRLAYGDLKVDGMAASTSGAMLAPKMVQAVQRMLVGAAEVETVRVDLTEAKARFVIGSTTLVGKLIDATAAGYLDYKRILPKAYLGELVVDTDLIIGAIKRIMIMAESRTLSVWMNLRAGTASITSRNVADGDAAEEVDADWSGPDFDTCFNGQFMLEHLAQVRTENVVIKVSSKDGPMVLSDTGQGDWLAFLMPQAK